jgi:hypothetical protein
MKVTVNSRTRAKVSLTAKELAAIVDALEVAASNHRLAAKMSGRNGLDVQMEDRFTDLLNDLSDLFGRGSYFDKRLNSAMPAHAELSFTPPEGSVYDRDDGNWALKSDD